MKKLYYFVLFLSILSCKDETEPMNLAKRPINEIVSEVYNGNIDAYQELEIVYYDMPPAEFLFYAMLMANKYDYGPAYFDVYNTMKNAYERGGENFKVKDKKTKEFLMKYLNEAVARNVDGAKEEFNAVSK